jgi:hypothetical protein
MTFARPAGGSPATGRATSGVIVADVDDDDVARDAGKEILRQIHHGALRDREDDDLARARSFGCRHWPGTDLVRETTEGVGASRISQGRLVTKRH